MDVIRRSPATPRAGSGGHWRSAERHPAAGRAPARPAPRAPPRAGPPRAAKAVIAASVTCSQPFPRWDAGAPGCTVEHSVEQQDARAAQGERSPLVGRGRPRSSASSVKMFVRLFGQRPHVGSDREREPHWVAGSWVRVLPDDEHAHGVQRRAECSQDVLACRKVPASGRDLGAQELADPRNGRGLGFEGRQPRRDRPAQRADEGPWGMSVGVDARLR